VIVLFIASDPIIGRFILHGKTHKAEQDLAPLFQRAYQGDFPERLWNKISRFVLSWKIWMKNLRICSSNEIFFGFIESNF
jgi:hypothetical protein